MCVFNATLELSVSLSLPASRFTEDHEERRREAIFRQIYGCYMLD